MFDCPLGVSVGIGIKLWGPRLLSTPIILKNEL